ncbi:MAG: prepilin peptidase [Solirubrobacterales bacterium]|nr:prepilin peptidase [Solirubrobacterales bacterium]
MPALILFPLGLVLGSFVTAVAHRVPRGESWVAGRSQCPSCKAEIAAYDNVPLLSWLVLGGRCRRCRAPISARYPLTELGLALLYVATYLLLGTDSLAELALGLIFCTLLAAITLTDLERRVIPNQIVLAGSVAALAIVLFADPSSLAERAIAALAAGGVLFVVVMAYPRGMGMGDAKLAGVMGLYLGAAVAPAILIGLLAGSVLGAALLARHGSAARKMAIPFGPFLALGGVVALWFGEAIVNWYAGRFG